MRMNLTSCHDHFYTFQINQEWRSAVQTTATSGNNILVIGFFFLSLCEHEFGGRYSPGDFQMVYIAKAKCSRKIVLII